MVITSTVSILLQHLYICHNNIAILCFMMMPLFTDTWIVCYEMDNLKKVCPVDAAILLFKQTKAPDLNLCQ